MMMATLGDGMSRSRDDLEGRHEVKRDKAIPIQTEVHWGRVVWYLYCCGCESKWRRGVIKKATLTLALAHKGCAHPPGTMGSL